MLINGQSVPMSKLYLGITFFFLIIDSTYALNKIEQSEMLATHNQFRIEVNIPKLKWSSSLAKTAQAYANKLATTGGCRLAHSGKHGVGENLYWASPITQTVTSSNGETKTSFKPQDIVASSVVEAWANEKRDYEYSTNTCSADKVCGHYTQLIWKSTMRVGCAKAMCGDRSQVWVCHYSPPGNYIGQKPF